MEREVIIQRASTLLIALMMGYVLECSNGMILKVDENGDPWIKNQEGLVKADFQIDIKYLQRQAELLPEREYLRIVQFVATGACLGV